MAQYYTEANMKHILANIAPKSRSLYVLVEFEVFGNIHGISESCSSTNRGHSNKSMQKRRQRNLVSMDGFVITTNAEQLLEKLREKKKTSIRWLYGSSYKEHLEAK